MNGNTEEPHSKPHRGTGLTTKLRWVFTALLSTSGLIVQADILTRTTADGGADAHVRGSESDTNFGDSAVVTARSSNGTAANNYKVYFRFDLSGSGLDQANAISVTIEFTTLTARNNAGLEFFGLPDGLAGDDVGGWTETGLTYNNAPGNVAATGDRNYLTTSPGDENGNYLQSLGTLTPVTTTVGGVVSFSSPLLLDLVRNDLNGLITIALNRSDNANLIDIVARETATTYQPPRLVVEANPIPEPSPITLAVGGFLVLLFRFGAQWTLRR